MTLSQDINMDKAVIYQAENGALVLHTYAQQDTIWASLDQMAQLFARDKSVISRHIKNIFKDEELVKDAVVAKNVTTASDGKIYQVANYNLDMILSVGYRVNSKLATKFRQWANKILNQHITNGFTINEKVLEKNKTQFLQTLEDL